MRIDDENKVVWCSESEMEWYTSFNVSVGNTMISDMKRIAHLSTEKEMVMRFNVDLNTRLQMINAIAKGYEFKVKEQKYYWRKKKEHLAWFEKEDKTYLNHYVFKNIPSYIKEISLGINESNLTTGYDTKFTEQQARNLLKDDFDKFEKVECE